MTVYVCDDCKDRAREAFQLWGPFDASWIHVCHHCAVERLKQAYITIHRSEQLPGLA